MATLQIGSFETGNVSVTEILEALGTEWGYQPTVPDPQNPGQTMPNPQNRAGFCREQLKRILTEAYRNGKRKVLVQQAEAAVPNIDLS